MKRLPGASHSRGALASRSARRSCAKSRNRSARPCPPGYGPLFNVAWPRNPYSVINARVRFRQLWKPFSLLESFPPVPAPIPERRGLRFCTVSDTLGLRREIFFCCWAQPKEHSSFARMLSGADGRSGGPIFTGTVFTRWPTMPAEGNTEYGLRRRVIGAPCSDRATISARAGAIRNRPPFDFHPIPAFP